MADLVAHWLVLGAALFLCAAALPGVTIASWSPLALGALLLLAVNAVAHQFLLVVTLRITVVTLAIFYLLLNGAAFGVAAALVPGFDVRSLMSGVLGALLTSVLAWFIGVFVRRD